MFCTQFNTSFKLIPSELVFSFGDSSQHSTRYLKIHISIPAPSITTFKLNFIRAFVPRVLGLDVLQSFSLVVDFGWQRISSSDPLWFLPHFYPVAHLFMLSPLVDEIFINERSDQLHLHFHDPITDRQTIPATSEGFPVTRHPVYQDYFTLHLRSLFGISSVSVTSVFLLGKHKPRTIFCQ